MDQHQAVPDQAGLATPPAIALRARIGVNAIADIRPHLIFDALQKFWAPVPWLLEAAIVLQLVLGDFTEAGIVGLLLGRVDGIPDLHF